MRIYGTKKRLQKLEANMKKGVSRLEHEKNIKEVEAIMAELDAEYNSPEAVAEREARYQEAQRIGELRRQAYMRGEPMSKYPLPWETNKE